MPDPVLATLTSPWGVFLLVLVGTACGWFVYMAAPDARAHVFGVMVRGTLGTLAGVWLAALLGLPALLALNIGTLSFPTAWALLGGIVFILMFRLLRI